MGSKEITRSTCTIEISPKIYSQVVDAAGDIGIASDGENTHHHHSDASHRMQTADPVVEAAVSTASAAAAGLVTRSASLEA